MHKLAITITIILLHTPLFAQEVEFEIPTEIDIVQGQLSVVFNDDVDKEEALQILEQFQYEILDINFSPTEITGEVGKPLTKKTLRKIKAHKGVLDAQSFTTPAPIFSTQDSMDSTESKAMVTVSFQPGTTSQKAKKIVKKYTKLVSINIHSLPNEVIIAVGDQDEEAFELLESNKNVKWVSYVGTTEES